MNVMWLQISAGVGPAECAWVVARLQQVLVREAETQGLQTRVLEAIAGPEPRTLRSVLLSVEGAEALQFARTWVGTVQWIGTSPFRPRHRRKNWFVGVTLLQPPPEAPPVGEVRLETLRASGAGGQNVNKVETAVRAIHVATGLSVVAREERSQYLNRQLALARLQARLLAQTAQAEADNQHSRWAAHYQLERGNAEQVFVGPDFQRRL